MFLAGPGFEPGLNHMFPAGCRFSRNLAAPGEFSGFFWSIGTAFALRNLVHFALLTVPPPPAAIRGLLGVFGVLGDLEKICGRPGPEMGQKSQRSGFFRSWGPFWVERPPTKSDRMLTAPRVNPVLGPMCPWDPSYGRFGGALGAILSVGTGFVG